MHSNPHYVRQGSHVRFTVDIQRCNFSSGHNHLLLSETLDNKFRDFAKMAAKASADMEKLKCKLLN